MIFCWMTYVNIAHFSNKRRSVYRSFGIFCHFQYVNFRMFQYTLAITPRMTMTLKQKGLLINSKN